MRTLIVAATTLEIAPLLARLEPVSQGPVSPDQPRLQTYTYKTHQVDVLITGVGMVATSFWCARTLAKQEYELALNLGVCGTFDPTLPLGKVVHVASDFMPELGAQDGSNFLDIHTIGLLDKDEAPYKAGRLVNPRPLLVLALSALPKARGITVNTVHGEDATIARTTARFKPQVESMEGAAFMYACLASQVRFAQIRAISNKVERRNRASWKLDTAITSLCETATAILDQL
jgi:futalosine hydrolase